MMRGFFNVALCLIAVLFMVTPVQAQAQTSIAVVDVQSLLTSSKAAKSIQKQTQDYRDTFLEKLSKQEKDLREKEKALMEKAKSLSKEDLMNEKKSFEEQYLKTQNMAKVQKKSIDQAYGTAMNTLMNNVYEAVQAVADDKSYNLVVTKQSVVIGEDKFDITDDVMGRLNKKVSNIKMKLSGK